MLYGVKSYKNQHLYNHKHPKVDDSQYLSHRDEPDDNQEIVPPEIQEELLSNRFFLKSRVWKTGKRNRRLSVRYL